MSHDAPEHDGPDRLDDGRRSFLKKMAVGGALAAPVVSSFSMTGVSAAYAQTPTVSGRGAGGGSGPDVGGTDVTNPPTSTTTPPTTTTMVTNTNQPPPP